MRNTYILMIIQALLTLLLFFSESYLKYITIFLFVIFDFVLFIDVLTKKFSADEVLTLGAILCSGVFLLFYIFMKSAITTVFGIALMLLFLVIAMLNFISETIGTSGTLGERVENKNFDRLQKPEEPAYYYDVEYDSQINAANSRINATPQPVARVIKTPQQTVKPATPVPSKADALSKETRDKLFSKAVEYELQREAAQLQDAERKIKNLEIYNTEKELLKESLAMEQAQKTLDKARRTQAVTELKKEAAEILAVQKQINEINKIQKVKAQSAELQREAKALKKAEKQIKEVDKIRKVKAQSDELQREAKALKKAEKQINEMKFLDQQEKIVKQAKAIAQAQKDIDGLKKKKPASKAKKKEVVKVKTVSSKDESFYFATENGNKFHDPGCLALKNVPKNRLVLYTNKKDPMKKGLQPCARCIPR